MAMADSPITQVSQDTTHEAMISSSANSPITQVAPPPAPPPTAAQYYTPGQQFYPSKFILDLRGTRFDLDRETLVALPESILVVMFPNGLILRPKSSGGGGGATNATITSSASATAAGTGVGGGRGGAGIEGAGRGVGGTAVTAGQLKGKSSAGGGLAQAAAAAALGASAGAGTSVSAGVVGNNSGIATGHGHYPSESTYTDYSDYSDYSYDDYDDDDDDGHGLDREELLDDEDLTDDDDEEEEQVIVVDFDPVCLQYILDNYRQAQRAGELERRIRKQEHERQLKLQLQQQQHLLQQLQLQQQQQGSAASTTTPAATSTGEATDVALPTSSESSASSSYHQPLPLNSMVPQNPLLNKQAIIVLREELDYFVIPPPSTKGRPPTSGTAPVTATSISSSKPLNGLTSTTPPVTGPQAQTSRDSADGPLPLLGTAPAITPSSTTKSAGGASTKVNGSVPPRTSTSSTAAPSDQQPKMIKTQCGQILLKDRKIFAALQRNIDKEKNQAEQQLMDMLCVSGFQKEGEWGYRRVEPKRTTVVSVAMVMLRTTAQPYSTTAAASPSSSSAPTAPTVPTPATPTANEQSATAAAGLDQETNTTRTADGNNQATPPQQDETQVQQQQQQEQKEEQERVRERREQEQKQIRIQQQQQQQQQQFQMAIAEKLLLFWRKPARKCWWDGIQVEVHQDPSDTTITPLVPVRLWARRTWTLELVLV
ncbi:hypothetical protein EC957_000484 [Mortierella hygrophila]|uniref:Uncharacterized protein n=1 Tax=Mortierella hygrophila TaxID=979708 RepID=A0A9P6F705_9FUNG|nr:hypothetical protein EC957_000484 [Mortierella hygrophila]